MHKIEKIEFDGSILHLEVSERDGAIRVELGAEELHTLLGDTPFYGACLIHRKGENKSLFFLFSDSDYEEYTYGLSAREDLLRIACECAIFYGRDGRDPEDPANR